MYDIGDQFLAVYDWQKYFLIMAELISVIGCLFLFANDKFYVE